MHCPACQHPMVIVEFRDVEVDMCPSCKGCWLDQDELGLILHEDFAPPQRWNVDPERKSDRRCPHCRAKLGTGPLPDTRVRVDVCPLHHGMWLDAGELESIIGNTRARGDAETLRQHLADLFGEKETQIPSRLETRL